MEYLIGIIVALLGAFFYQNSKRKTAEALNQNIETKTELNKFDQSSAKDQGLIDAEMVKRAQIEKEMHEMINKNVDIKDLEDFLNRKH